ncbi:PAS/PAC sensor hybrid histidine kinase [Rhodopseudomonas palustris HaA2]|uniref:histidine kinase n=1 Tax=Rhodopseudomonas palustris (strain HaA2) TaxID=316058 RepID=Q2ITE8_RHOP2|nr:ATP-binding protein [Rhodopseudomonas palustris]ABD08512.1 PAS/PAC sensor hybrid histidine kinase [Rhodopseudomonas palustris HaA2]
MADVEWPGSSPGRGSAGHENLFLGRGELTTLLRQFDWAATSLGPPEHWPQALKTAVRIMLTSQQPIWIGWGLDLIYLYNDPYKAIIGGKHPWALGRPTREVWHEIWDDIAPLLAKATSGDEGTYVEAQLLIMERNGFPEETYYTFSYSPIPTEDGSPGGIFCANTDDTKRVISERQLSLLRDLASSAAQSRTVAQACDSAARALATDARDLPFALIYLVEPGDASVRLAASAGIDADHPGVKPVLSLEEGAEYWPLAEALQFNEPRLMRDLPGHFGFDFPAGGWRQPPSQAIVVPIQSSGDTGHSGFLIAGLNPFRLYDTAYRDFLTLVAAQIAAAITNGDSYEEERRRAEALAEIDRAKTAFFSNVSHEFRTPLTLMLSPLEDVLNQATLPNDQQALLGIAHRNGLRLLKLVNTLLDFARIEAGRVTAHFTPVDLSSFTAELASNFRSAIDKAGLRLTIDAPPLPQPVHVDRDMWEKVVLNLLSNAFKFTFEGEIAVTLRPTPDGRSAEIVVRDTGTGIPPDEIPHLFERFRRIDGARGRSIEGSGIGLALVQELVKLHSGSIGVESELGRGSAFRVTLPFGAAHLPADRPRHDALQVTTNIRAQAYLDEAMGWLQGERDPETDAPYASTAEDLGRGTISSGAARPRILLADDNPDMRDYVTRLLGESYEVETVGDGVAALEAAWKHRPDLVISDIMMPRLDGLSLLKALRSDSTLADVPVIFLSARAGEEARVEGLEAGADDYLSKPFSARELLARVRSNLDIAEVRREALRTEHALRQESQAARQRAEGILASISDGFIALDADYRFTYVNAAAERMMRRSASDLIGKVAAEAYPAVVGSRIEDSLRRALTQRIGSEFEIEHPSSDRWFHLRVAPTNGESVSVYFRDITERKRTETALRDLNDRLEEQVAQRTAELRQKEARLRTIFAASYTYQALLDVDGAVIDANLTSLSGIGARLEDVVGQPLWDTPWFAGTPGMQQTIRDDVAAVAAGQSVRREMQLDLPVGGWRWFDFQMRPVHDAQGQIIAIVPEAVEITERRKAEEAFRQAQKMEAIGQLTGGVAHDFNNLLTVIRSSADLLRRRELPPERMRRYVDAISDTADRAAKLTGQLLTFARRHAQNRQVFDAAGQIEQTAEMLRTALGSRASFALKIDQRPLAVEADANQFDAAMVNLVANARDAMDGQGALEIRVAAAAPTAQETAAGVMDVVAVSIADTGAGIPQDQIDRIFEPFFTTKDVGRGTGLGLSQVYGFVKQSGGNVTVESALGCGTTITLRLPLSSKPIEVRDRVPNGDTTRPAERRCVLVVEDNAEVGEFSTQLLHDLGYETVLATSAEQALQLLDQDDAARFHLVLSDVVMPGMDGVALGREIRRRLPHLPVVLNSGYAHVLADDGHHGFELLHKPYSVEDLSKVLRRALMDSRRATS